MIKLFNVYMSDSVDNAVVDVLHSGYIGEGKKVVEFENVIGDVVGNHNVLAMNSGTSAITMALRLAGVEYGDYVISTPMTCIATNTPILALGAIPVWADVNPKTGNVSAVGIVNAINASPKLPKAILCMHWGGYACDLNAINAIGSEYNIPVIEDAAHAFGAIYDGKPIGSHSDFVCFSFQAIKYVTSVDGGAIVCKSEMAKERGKLMRWYGFDRSKSATMRCLQDPIEYGYKFHMNDVNATIGIENAKHLNDILVKTRCNASMYFGNLQGLSKVKLLEYQLDRLSTYWQFTLLVDSPVDFVKHMKNKGIACSQVHGRNDKKTIFKNSTTNLPGVDEFSSHQVSIPVGYWLSEDDVEYIIEVIRRY